MNYFEVIPADNRYRASTPLTYCYDGDLDVLSVVTVELKNRVITGFVMSKVSQPKFPTKTIKAVISQVPLPQHCFALAKWMSGYYASSLPEALRLFTPTKPVIRNKVVQDIPATASQLELHGALRSSQINALENILDNKSTTVLLHGETGSGKTRVYIELIKKVLGSGKSALILTPEITLTSQLSNVLGSHIQSRIIVLHSQLTGSERKRLWLEILNAKEPIVIIGPRSTLFSPVNNLGLIVLDESHEPAYKQDQSIRYQATTVASQLGLITGSKVVLGSATPSVSDYYLAKSHDAVIEMSHKATGLNHTTDIEVVDLKDRANFSSSKYISRQLTQKIIKTLKERKQVIIYLNRRGSSRLILCTNCGWQLTCPNCDIPLVYHSDKHQVRCHICNYSSQPPQACPECSEVDLIYKSIGSKALALELSRLFPNHVIKRFDGDNVDGERLDQLYSQVASGEVDILVGTQILAKGLDLPKLGLVGIVAAESSMGIPDFSSEERAFQLLYQIIGRVGRGHGAGNVVIQTYEPESLLIKAATRRDWGLFYKTCISDRKKYKFPPFSYMLQITIKRSTQKGAERSASQIKQLFLARKFSVEIAGPSPAFYARRGQYFYYQLVVKSKDRKRLVELAKLAPSDCQINLDPINLL